jgi:hypothetical protein
MFYRSWKYWHAPMLHAKAFAVGIACDVYLEVCKGRLSIEWYIRNPVVMIFASQQMLHYLPTNRKYPGDTLMRPSTQQHSSRRTVDKDVEEDDDNNDHQPARKRGRPKELDDDEVVGKVTKEQLKKNRLWW